jgi:type 1 glutamine amidotransferase
MVEKGRSRAVEEGRLMLIMVLSGAGRYADPWHDFPATSARLAEVLSGPGREVRVSEEVEAGLAALDGVDLLVVNVGDPADGSANPESPEAIAGLRTYADAGGPVLAVHSAASTFTTEPRWSEIIGGRWIRGTSMHPPYGPAHLSLRAADHPITAGLGDLHLPDERYSYLATEPGITVLYEHEHDGLQHPVIWAVEADGRRAVYDGLGHAVPTYADEAHRRLLRQAVSWLLRE